jgi:lauroyl/myristoyl acyltransferase
MSERPRVFFQALDLGMVGIFHLSRALVRVLPPRAVYAFAGLLGRAGLAARPGMHRRVRESIAGAYPGIGEGGAEAVARQASASFFLPMPMFFLYGKDQQRYLRELAVEGMEHLEEADARGRGTLVLYTHLGAFSLLVQLMANIGKPFTPITLAAESTPLPRYLEVMQEYGMQLGCDPEVPAIFAGEHASGQVLELLARGRRVGVTVDALGSSVVEFFGRPAGLGSGIAHFALDSGAPIVPAALLDTADTFRRRLVFYPALSFQLTGERERDVAAIMHEAAAAAERQIREDPGQWLSWFGLRQMWEKGREAGEQD